MFCMKTLSSLCVVFFREIDNLFFSAEDKGLPFL
ncbi:hypothetical protein UMN798_p0003 (plasmid) [Salmonella enterica subsp. enterica serovar Typhimurium str. 798]|nr:hypothetical protein UMN798_p0003 [Salmonella enterica subsp. enterica serovar Typhimurium str. 798]